MLLTCSDPLRIFLYHDGLVRLATKKYKQPKNKNLDQLFMHLTNYSVNRKNKDFIKNTGEQSDGEGHKRSILWMNEYFKSLEYDTDKLWRRIKKLIIKTFCSG